MTKIANNLIELIGKTPIVKLNHLSEKYGVKIIAKLESFNPGSSIKDRTALSMITAAEKEGKLLPGGTIIEPTSGNTGIGLAWIGAVKGYKVILTMPETMSVERRKLLKAYGAEIVLTDGSKGMQGAIDKAAELYNKTENSFVPQQFENSANPQVHNKTTAQEIWQATDGQLDIFIAGVGTGGTITGIGEFLKKDRPSIKIIAVEPKDSAVLSGGQAGPHKIQGIGAGFVPKVLNKKIIDEIIAIDNEAAFAAARQLAKTEGILCGISSGAAITAAEMMAVRPENKGKTITVILPDTGERYLSTELFE